MPERDVVVEGGGGPAGLRQLIRIGRHELASDEPVDAGGDDTGPTPYELLAAALGPGTSMTIALYARRKGWPLAGLRVTVRHDRVHATDCADCDSVDGRIDRLTRTIELGGPLDDNQRARLLDIAGK